ncbi:alpha/beta hydrolase [Demequina oxidasica]|uniref:alpha/beta hydrolase n=1 Tax=Demequina oxidasica TaxID=676199 RepID=UPI0007810B66|nr:alpha/beta-hydrolase family protein [Demequina oxidasica]
MPVDSTAAPKKRLRARRTIFSPWFNRIGLLTALLFASLSLVPSLLPRTPVTQGLVTGVAMMLGYGIGVGLRALWRFFELPIIPTRARRTLALITLVALLALLVDRLWRYLDWQNGVRELFGMTTLSMGVWVTITVVAALSGTVLLLIARTTRVIVRAIAHLLSRFLPHRLAHALGIAVSSVGVWLLVTGVLTNAFFTGANWTFSPVDLATAPGVEQPQNHWRSGSPYSYASWDSLGRQGRNFVAGGPSAQDLDTFNKTDDAKTPVRVYVGLRSAESAEERTQLLLDELIRSGGFEREALVLAVTTGTGWLDANAMSTIEYMYNGDTAIAGYQYSYLPSWISTLADQDVVREESVATFRAIQDYWSTLDPDSRPDIYLFGLSLGSYGVEAILRSPSIINEPIAGALMAGPTFLNPMHAELTEERDWGTSPTLPIFDGGRTVRFTAGGDNLTRGTGPWGPSRIVYLQNSSDPVVFFSPELAWQRPAWLDNGDRPADVSPDMGWAPVVTMLQVAIDLAAADGVPTGHGHRYSTEQFAVAWAGLTGDQTWDHQRNASLAEFISKDQAGLGS